MKYGLSISDQISHFLFAVGFGFLIGIFYRIVFAVRQTKSNKKSAYIVQDVFFSVVTTVLSFLFMLVYSNGEVRLDLIVAIFVGSAIYFVTVDKLVKSIVEPVALLIKKLIGLILSPAVAALKLIKKLSKKCKASMLKTNEKLKDIGKKAKMKNEKPTSDDKPTEKFDRKNRKATKIKHEKSKKVKKNK